MGSFDTTLVLLLAFGLGMLHALDADHVMAVSGLASSNTEPRSRMRNSLRFCLRWAVGHGLVLFCIACAVYLFGLSIPAGLSEIAETLVGIVLIFIGLVVVRDLVKHKAHLHFHQHGHNPAHAHWHTHDRKHNTQEFRCDHSEHQRKHSDVSSHDHSHSAVLVGMLHGTAGSAPLLALIPVAQQESPMLGMLYVLLFSLGVVLSMLLFGGLLGVVFNGVQHFGTRFVYALRATVALSAMIFGGLLLRGTLL